MTSPDFETLRAHRNARVQEIFQKLADEHGMPLESMQTTFNPNACYCDCGNGGPCEHTWDGEPWESDGLWTATCSRCGCTAFSHNMRTAP